MRLRIQHKGAMNRLRHGATYAVFETESDYFAITFNCEGSYENALKVLPKESWEPWTDDEEVV